MGKMQPVNLYRSVKMTMFVYLSTTLFIVSLCVDNGGAVRAPAPVDVNKCCPIGQKLDGTEQCIDGGSKQWWPNIFMPLKQVYFEPHGEAPRFMRIREHTKPDCMQPQLFWNDIVLFSNGSLYLAERNIFVGSDMYCVDQDMAMVCLPNSIKSAADSLLAPANVIKVRKCCLQHSLLRINDTKCIPEASEHSLSTRTLITPSNATHVDMVYGLPKCIFGTNNKYILEQFRERKLNSQNGSYLLESHKMLNPDDFCIDHTEHNSNVVTDMVFACADLLTANDVIVNEEQRNEESRRFLIYSIFLMISVIFLSMTLAIGFLLPSNHHVLHCRCQTYYVGCLLIGDLLLAINQTTGPLITGIPCSIMATAMHFFFLAAFFWLNVSVFNIYWTFRDFRPTTLGKKQEKIRLRLYKIYAWGFAFLITAIAAVIDNLPHSHNLPRPRFAEKTCWFFGDMEIFVYFFGPIGFLLLVNIILFASTTRQLMCGLWKQDDIKSSTERAALGRVCMKLVVVMGITWIADVLSWAHNVWITQGNAHDTKAIDISAVSHGVRYYFFYIMDSINALQGVLIFLVVASQPQVLAAITRLFSPKNSRSKLNTTHGQQHSSSSNGLASIGDSMTNNTFNNTTSSKIPMETIC